MSIENFKPKAVEVRYGDGEDESFHVRAISLVDVGQIVAINQATIEILYTKIQEHGGMSDDIPKFMAETMQEAPYLAASIIAYAADEPQQIQTVYNMPIAVQLDALDKIYTLTFTDMASVKKLWASTKSLILSMLPANQTMLAAE